MYFPYAVSDREVYFGEIRTKYLRGGFVLSLQEQISVSALMAQAELGPVSLYTREIEYGQFVPTNLKKGTETLFNACLCHKHKSLKDLNRHVRVAPRNIIIQYNLVSRTRLLEVPVNTYTVSIPFKAF